jgi:hypothetical protein
MTYVDDTGTGTTVNVLDIAWVRDRVSEDLVYPRGSLAYSAGAT